MLNPKFDYTDKLVRNISKVGELAGALKARRFPNTVLMKLEQDARALSAYSSTTIEGNPLPLTDVKRIIKSKPENIRDSEREVLNYNNALEWLAEKIKNNDRFLLSNEFICEVQTRVIEGLVSENFVGKYRNKPVFVNDPRTRQTIYLPPDHEDVQMLMDELVEFINSKQGEIN
jgi:Fic family protein